MRAAWPEAVLLAAGLVAGLVACGGVPRAAPAAVTPARAPSTNGGAAEPGASRDGLPSLEALAARGPAEAPLMREALRTTEASPRTTEVRAETDLCLRALFAAAAPVRASFVDASGAPRGEGATGLSGSVPPRGPVCVKKGESLHLVLDRAEAGPSPIAHVVIFAAP